MYFVYIICNERGDMYVGYTNDVEMRVEQHNNGENISTRGSSWELVYYEAFANRNDALMRERKLKQRGQAKRHLKERIEGSMESIRMKLSAW